MTRQVIIDASIAVKWVVNERDSNDARDLLRTFLVAGVNLCAPPVILSELSNAFFHLARRDIMTVEQSIERFHDVIKPIEVVSPEGLYEKAIVIAVKLEFRQNYDSQYIALTEILAADLWTADGVLFNQTLRKYNFVHHLDELRKSVHSRPETI